jgi:small subunit ribosomal protein S17
MSVVRNEASTVSTQKVEDDVSLLPLLDPLGSANAPTPIRTRKTGTVVSDLNTKTLVVEVNYQVPHPKYHRLIAKRKKFHVHDEDELGWLGDTVEIQSCRPRSALKRWELVRVVTHGSPKKTVWQILPMDLVAELDPDARTSELPQFDYALRFSLAPSQTALFPDELFRSGRPLRIEIRFSGDRIQFDKTNIQLSYFIRKKLSTSETVGIAFVEPDQPIEAADPPSIEASVLFDRTLVQVKRFKLDPATLGTRSN